MAEHEHKKQMLVLWQPQHSKTSKGQLDPTFQAIFIAKGSVQDWPCYLYRGWDKPMGDRAYIRYKEADSTDSYLSVPLCVAELAVSAICDKCTNQFACLAGNTGRLTVETLISSS